VNLAGASAAAAGAPGHDGHPLEWTPERIGRFWTWLAIERQDSYFARHHGAGFTRFMSRLVPLGGRVLDVGCGQGFLADHLLRHGIANEGCDASQAAVDHANRRFAGRPGWGGAALISAGRLPYADASMDVVICMETIEHVTDADLTALVAEMRRILKPGTGRLLLTTPNAEDLGRSMIYCPECSAVFHTVQHLRSWSAGTLTACLERGGLATLRCGAIDLDYFQIRFSLNPLRWSPLFLCSRGWEAALRLVDVLRGPSPDSLVVRRWLDPHGPHLFWLGARPGRAQGDMRETSTH